MFFWQVSSSPLFPSNPSLPLFCNPMAAPAAGIPAVSAARRSSFRAFSGPEYPLAGLCLPAVRTPPPPLRLARPPRAGLSSRVVVASAQSNFLKVVQTAWRVSKDAVEAGTNLVPDSVPRPIASIGVTFVAASVALFLLKSVVSTAFFVLAMMGLIYFGFLAMNPKEGSRVDESSTTSSEDDPVEEARRIMEKYK